MNVVLNSFHTPEGLVKPDVMTAQKFVDLLQSVGITWEIFQNDLVIGENYGTVALAEPLEHPMLLMTPAIYQQYLDVLPEIERLMENGS